MPSKRSKLKRRSFFVDEAALKRAKRFLRASSDAEAIRLSLERVAEMERQTRFLDESAGSLPPGSFGEY